MNGTFQNQLNEREIRQGIRVFLCRRLWPFLMLAALGIFVLLCVNGMRVVYAICISVGGILLSALLFAFLLKRQFSTQKVATYRLHSGKLEIINSNGAVNTYLCREMKRISAKDVIVLCFPKDAFAIVAKRNIQEEVMDLL